MNFTNLIVAFLLQQNVALTPNPKNIQHVTADGKTNNAVMQETVTTVTMTPIIGFFAGTNFIPYDPKPHVVSQTTNVVANEVVTTAKHDALIKKPLLSAQPGEPVVKMHDDSGATNRARRGPNRKVQP